MTITPNIEKQFSELHDNEIIAKVLSGEKGLYEILLRRNNQKLYRVIRGYLNDHDDIEDIMQETYLTAFEKLFQFNRSAQFSTWLIRIGINKALQRIKKSKSIISLSSEAHTHEFAISQLSPENMMIRNESKNVLETAISNLEEKYRAIYIMREVEEMSIAEIADCMNLTESNVKVRIHRAKGLIKDNLYNLSFNNDLFEFGNKKCDILVEKVMKQLF
jgi:RNA polymerase sigma factor (sigma-70 family)